MENLIIRTKPTPKKAITRPSSSRFAFIRTFIDKYYRDQYKWGLIKCVAFFVGGVYAAKTLSEMDILPAEPPGPKSSPY